MSATRDEIATWCTGFVAELLAVPAATVEPDVEFDRLGIDSALAVSLLVEVEERYGVDLEPDALFANPTINAIAAHLEQRLDQQVPQ